MNKFKFLTVIFLIAISLPAFSGDGKSPDLTFFWELEDLSEIQDGFSFSWYLNPDAQLDAALTVFPFKEQGGGKSGFMLSVNSLESANIKETVTVEKTSNPDTFELFFSSGISKDLFLLSWYLDCFAPSKENVATYLTDSRLGFYVNKRETLSLGFETGAFLHIEKGGEISSYDIPLLLGLKAGPKWGIVKIPFGIKAGMFSSYTLFDRGISFGPIVEASVGVSFDLGESFVMGLETKADALMRLNVSNSRNSVLAFYWIPASVFLAFEV